MGLSIRAKKLGMGKVSELLVCFKGNKSVPRVHTPVPLCVIVCSLHSTQFTELLYLTKVSRVACKKNISTLVTLAAEIPLN